MSAVVVSGAKGFLGRHLVEHLRQDHEVITLSRRQANVELASQRSGPDALRPESQRSDHALRLNFFSREELSALDGLEVDVLVHLAAEIGKCSEEAGIEVNVQGTRTLMRYLIDRGCKRFVLASSICAAGFETGAILPRALPIPDDHPSCAVDPYGMSKALMEEVAFYFHRQRPDIEITIFRLGAVFGCDWTHESCSDLENSKIPFVEAGGMISLDSAVQGFAAAVNQPRGPGICRLNLVGDTSVTSLTVPKALELALGERASGLDFQHFEQTGRENASLYSVDRFEHIYGFRPKS